MVILGSIVPQGLMMRPFFIFNRMSFVEKRQGLKVACIEEIAYRMNYITAGQEKNLSSNLLKNNYGWFKWFECNQNITRVIYLKI